MALPLEMAFFTYGRLALIGALKADTTLAEKVKRWYDFGPGIRVRYAEDPAWCPLIRVIPAETPIETPTNELDHIPQRVEIYIMTDNQDAAECELLAARVIQVLREERSTRFNLFNEGLTNVLINSVFWQAVEDTKAERIRWRCAIMAEMDWFRHMM